MTPPMVGPATAAAIKAQQQRDPAFQIKALRKEMNQRLDTIEQKIDELLTLERRRS